ncbi:hypothetical protein [Streptomyces sp. bgisy027]
MTVWTREEFTEVEAAGELQISTLGRAGRFRESVQFWVVADGDDL